MGYGKRLEYSCGFSFNAIILEPNEIKIQTIILSLVKSLRVEEEYIK